MSGINSKLSGVIAGTVLIFGVITDAFAAQDDVAVTVLAMDDSKEIVQDVCEEDEIAEVETNSIHTVYGVVQLQQVERPSEEHTEAKVEQVTKKETASEAVTKAGTEKETEVETTEAESVAASGIGYNKEDYDNLLRIVEAEATGGDKKSKILVANVVINRVKSRIFPNTLTEVIFQENGLQFQPVMDGRFYTVTVSQATVEAVNRALAGEDYSQGATYFASLYAAGPGSWHAEHLTKLFEYGGHAFFVE